MRAPRTACPVPVVSGMMLAGWVDDFWVNETFLSGRDEAMRRWLKRILDHLQRLVSAGGRAVQVWISALLQNAIFRFVLKLLGGCAAALAIVAFIRSSCSPNPVDVVLDPKAELLALNSRAENLRNEYIRCNLKLARLSLEEGNYASLLATTRKIVCANHGHVEALIYQGVALEMTGQRDKASEAYERARASADAAGLHARAGNACQQLARIAHLNRLEAERAQRLAQAKEYFHLAGDYEGVARVDAKLNEIQPSTDKMGIE